MNRFGMFFVLGLVTLASQSFGDAKSFFFERSESSASTWGTETISTHWFEQRINHNFFLDRRTFQQRFFVDKQFAKTKDAPVFFYLCGEGVCKPRSLAGQIKDHARKFEAVMVALEHRYYGKSQPFTQLTTNNLKYLTVDYALKDARSFQRYFRRKFGYRGKWIVIGGSYPGNLAAAYRMRYPWVVSGALASSAPVMAKENFEDYDAHVTKVAGPQCVKNIRRMVQVGETALKTPSAWEQLKKDFEASDVKNDIDVLYLLADISAAAVQYGMKDEFCRSINVPDVQKGYSAFARKLFSAWQMKAVDLTFQSAESLDPDDYLGGFAMRQWLYQSCTEYGYWQAAHHDVKKSCRSRKITLEYHREACKRLFGLEKPANVAATNRRYYQPLFSFRASQILFTNGSTDPWSVLSVNEQTVKQNPKLDYYMIQGAAHCDDLRNDKLSDTAALKGSRSQFRTLVKKWLEL